VGRWEITLLLYFVAVSAAFAVLIPPFEAPDEPFHLAYINFVATRGELPNQYDPGHRVEGQGHQHPLYYVLTGAVVRMTGSAVQVEPRGNPRNKLFGGSEWDIPVFDHRTGSAFASKTDAIRFYALRLLSVALNGLNLFLTWKLVRLFSPDAKVPALALLLMATLPQFLFISATINNDNLANVFGTLTILLSFRILTEPDRIRHYLGLGLALGLGVLAKKTLFFAIPVVGLILAYVWIRGRRMGQAIPLVRILQVLALTLLICGWLFVRNYHLYGEVLGSAMEEATLSRLVEKKSLFSDYFVTVFPRDFAASFVGRFGWLSVRPPVFIQQGYALLALLATAGLIAHLVASRFRDVKILFALLFIFSGLAGSVFYNLTYSQPQGRHLFPALSLVVLLAALGLRSLVPARAPRLAAGLLTGLLVLMDAVALVAVYLFYYRDWRQYG
jgi:4-amino-4-deoxy-L-arabinose transferase-like glycosyltransferase